MTPDQGMTDDLIDRARLVVSAAKSAAVIATRPRRERRMGSETLRRLLADLYGTRIIDITDDCIESFRAELKRHDLVLVQGHSLREFA